MIVSLQYLRAAAALMVVAYHAGELLRRTAGEAAFSFTAGNGGVDIFFVLSGFIILHSTRSARLSPAEFFRRRFVRIVPLYWVLTLLLANLSILAPSLVHSAAYDGPHLLASLSFLPYRHPTIEGLLPVLVPGWTLNYEMAFYALFGAALILPIRFQVGAVVCVLVGAVAVRWSIPYHPLSAFYTMPLVLEFGCGLMLAVAYRAGLAPSASLCLGALVTGVFLLFWLADTGLWRSLSCGLPATLIVAGAVFLERRRPVPKFASLLLLGDASYSIYLTHIMALPMTVLAFKLAALPLAADGGIMFFVAALLMAGLAGITCHLWLERPLLAIASELSRPRGSHGLDRTGYRVRPAASPAA